MSLMLILITFLAIKHKLVKAMLNVRLCPGIHIREGGAVQNRFSFTYLRSNLILTRSDRKRSRALKAEMIIHTHTHTYRQGNKNTNVVWRPILHCSRSRSFFLSFDVENVVSLNNSTQAFSPPSGFKVVLFRTNHVNVEKN